MAQSSADPRLIASITTPLVLTTFVTNGGEVKITSNTGTISVYDITYFITRTYTR